MLTAKAVSRSNVATHVQWFGLGVMEFGSAIRDTLVFMPKCWQTVTSCFYDTHYKHRTKTNVL